MSATKPAGPTYVPAAPGLEAITLATIADHRPTSAEDVIAERKPVVAWEVYSGYADDGSQSDRAIPVVPTGISDDEWVLIAMSEGLFCVMSEVGGGTTYRDLEAAKAHRLKRAQVLWDDEHVER